MKVLTVGVYDLLHIGHIHLFKRASRLGDCLIVAVQESDFVEKYKPNSNLVYSTEERMYMVKAVRYVDKVISYSSVDKIVREVDFDIFVKGPDQTHEGFINATKWCLEHEKEVVTLPRTEGVSTSWLKEQISLMNVMQ